MVRIVRMVAAAEDAFGDRGRALQWLELSHRALEGQTALSMVDTDLGANTFERLLGQIAHGVAA